MSASLWAGAQRVCLSENRDPHLSVCVMCDLEISSLIKMPRHPAQAISDLCSDKCEWDLIYPRLF